MLYTINKEYKKAVDENNGNKERKFDFMVTNINEKQYDQEVLNSKGLVLVDFYSETCGPCKRLAPILEELSNDFEGKLKIVKINVNENSLISFKMGIMSVPTLVFYKDGNMIESSVGLLPKEQLERIINEKLNWYWDDVIMKGENVP